MHQLKIVTDTQVEFEIVSDKMTMSTEVEVDVEKAEPDRTEVDREEMGKILLEVAKGARDTRN